MHAHRVMAPLLLAAALLAGCSKPAQQPTGTYSGPHFVIRFDTTSTLTIVGQRGVPDMHCDYTQDGDTLHVISHKEAPKHFDITMRIEDGAKFITITQMKNLDSGQLAEGEDRMSKVLAQQ